MKTALLFLLISLFLKVSTPVICQNLVPNPGFEEYHSCPPYPGQIHHAVGWDAPGGKTADFFHRCSPPEKGAGVPLNLLGSQEPHSGDGYTGIRTWLPRVAGNPPYREYLTTRLTEPLQAGETYALSFYLSSAETSGYVSDDIGMYLSDAPFEHQQIYDFVPQAGNPQGNILDNPEDWSLVKGFFTAKGGEQYLLIGNFLSDSLTTLAPNNSLPPNVYFYIDDVSIVKCGVLHNDTRSVDTLLCPEESLLLGPPTAAESYHWNDGSTLPEKLVFSPGSYTLRTIVACDTLTLTFNVWTADCNCDFTLPSLLSPGSRNIAIPENVTDIKLEIFDGLGRRLMVLTNHNPEDIGNLPLHGLYFWKAMLSCGSKKKKRQGKFVWIKD